MATDATEASSTVTAGLYLEVEDFSPPSSPEVEIEGVMEENSGPRPYMFEPLARDYARDRPKEGTDPDVEISMLDAFEDKISITQVVCEPKPELEICEDEATEPSTEEPPAVSPPAVSPPAPPTSPTITQESETKTPAPTVALPPETKPQWSVGAQCQAVWSEDGKVYAATIQAIDGERCTVKFDGYGNQEDMVLSSLRPAEPKTLQEWSVGSSCRARASDGLIVSAVVLWVQGQRCRVRFEHNNSEEEMDVRSLLSPDELNGPSRRSATWRPAFGTSNRRRREAPDNRDVDRGERGDRGERVDRGERGRDRIWKDPQHSTWPPRDRVPSQSREEREPAERRAADRGAADRGAAQSSLPFAFPPFPLPVSSVGPPSFVLPPPPFWAFGASETSAATDSTTQMLMLWYMCGFHTGSFLAQQQQAKSSPRD